MITQMFVHMYVGCAYFKMAKHASTIKEAGPPDLPLSVRGERMR